MKIDPALCTACGLCVEECPSGTLRAGSAIPEVAHPRRCVCCGHCMAICPVDAITADGSPLERFPEVEALPAGLSEIERLLRLKRSVRTFTDRPLQRSTVRSIIEHGERAPSSHNFRSRRYLAVTDAARIAEMESAVVRSYAPLRLLLNPLVLGLVSLVSRAAARELRSLRTAFDHVIESHREGETPVFRGAPCVICVAAPKRNTQGRDDCVAALQYMMLYAQSIGVSSCVIGYAQHAHGRLERLFRLPHSYAVHAVAVFGYARNRYERALRYQPIDMEIL